jgi:hypothetical protein
MASQNNLHQLALGFHNFETTYGGLPAPAITDPKTDKPLLSWRVAILPIVDSNFIPLYKQFKLDESWDGPHNKALIDQMPKVFAMPDAGDPPGHTRYQMITGPGTVCDALLLKPNQTFGRIGPGFKSITDGTSLTVVLAEGAAAVPWTKPDDLYVRPDRPLPAFGGYFPGGFSVALANGAVFFASDQVSPATWRAVFSARAGDIPGDDWPDGPPVRRAETQRTINSPFPPKK